VGLQWDRQRLHPSISYTLHVAYSVSPIFSNPFTVYTLTPMEILYIDPADVIVVQRTPFGCCWFVALWLQLKPRLCAAIWIVIQSLESTLISHVLFPCLRRLDERRVIMLLGGRVDCLWLCTSVCLNDPNLPRCRQDICGVMETCVMWAWTPAEAYASIKYILVKCFGIQ